MTEPRIEVAFPDVIAREFPEQFDHAWTAVSDTISLLSGMEFAPLERRSPALRGYDWSAYLRCSVARMVRMLKAVQRWIGPTGRVLDVGAYFGNFALMFQRAGYQVVALDSYEQYAPALAPCVAQLTQAGVSVADFATVGEDLAQLGREFDAVVCAGVVEHIPHTPRLFLNALAARIRPGGLLLLDTPNLAYLYTRQKLMRGESIFAPIESQYFTDVPFEGHHREYTVQEVRWMVEQCGLDVVSMETFNYSLFSSSVLTGIHAENYTAMMRDPSARELILCVAQQPRPANDVARSR